MEKRVVFRSAWLPWVLIAPQVLIITVFFFWPAAQALLQSVQQSDAFGTSVEWVGLENFRNLWNDETRSTRLPFSPHWLQSWALAYR